LKRREALADVALRYSVPVIEDDAYGMLPARAPDALASLAPDLTYYVTGFSKTFGAGLRVAYIRAPSLRRAQHLAGALRATTVMASPFTVLLATQWVADGTADLMLEAIRAESNARQAIVARVMDGFYFEADPNGFHFWMPIGSDSGWNASELALQLRSQGIGVVSATAFATDGNPPEAIRVCLGGPKTLGECEDAMRLIVDTVSHPHHLHLPVM
jgi:DNA-binding transcriptional MocR family regulator